MYNSARIQGSKGLEFKPASDFLLDWWESVEDGKEAAQLPDLKQKVDSVLGSIGGGVGPQKHGS